MAIRPVAALSDWLRWGAATQEVWMSAMADARAIARQREARLQALLEVAAAHSPVYRTRLRRGSRPAWRVSRASCADRQGRTDGPVRRLGHRSRDPVSTGSRHSLPTRGASAKNTWADTRSGRAPAAQGKPRHLRAGCSRAVDLRCACRRCGARARSLAASPLRCLAAGHRFAMIVALGGHFAGVVSWERLRTRQSVGAPADAFVLGARADR
jgi:hypothetical protein